MESAVFHQNAPNTSKVPIRNIRSGVQGLDEILGGGFPEFSLNLIAGLPGCGKTTLAHQIAFANAAAQSPALYFTVLGEPPLKMLRHQQQYSFYDALKIGHTLRFINLSELVIKQDLNDLYEEITTKVSEIQPKIIIIDSFRTLFRGGYPSSQELEMHSFIQRLGHFLTTWEATTFMVGEYCLEDINDSAIFTIADGLIWLWQVPERNSVVRKLQVMKLRGQGSVPGLHTMRINNDGVQAFSRTLGLAGQKTHQKTAPRPPPPQSHPPAPA
jgi:circadian clock protein KaiC